MAAVNLIHLQRAALIKRRLRDLDQELTACYADDYHVDVDRLLDERREVLEARDALMREQIA